MLQDINIQTLLLALQLVLQTLVGQQNVGHWLHNEDYLIMHTELHKHLQLVIDAPDHTQQIPGRNLPRITMLSKNWTLNDSDVHIVYTITLYANSTRRQKFLNNVG